MYLPMNKVSTTLNSAGIPNTDRVVKVQVYDAQSGVSELYAPDGQNMPGRLTIGDVSSDGFADILLTLKNANDTTSTQLLMNSPCNKKSCSIAAKDARRRTFVQSVEASDKYLFDDQDDFGDAIANDIYEGKFELDFDRQDYDMTGEEYGETLAYYKNVKYATFFDLLEDNNVDILLVIDDGSGRKIKAIYNNIDRGNFFLKVRMVSDEATFSSINEAAMRMVTTRLSDKKMVVQSGNSG